MGLVIRAVDKRSVGDWASLPSVCGFACKDADGDKYHGFTTVDEAVVFISGDSIHTFNRGPDETCDLKDSEGNTLDSLYREFYPTAFAVEFT